MNLCDTGPLVAIIDEADAYHAHCADAMPKLPPEPLLTTWPCLAEALHLLGKSTGLPGQLKILDHIAVGRLRLHRPEESDTVRIRELMNKYADAPMDPADASLVVAAESLGLKRIFTLDRHFHAYRIKDTDPFEIVP